MLEAEIKRATCRVVCAAEVGTGSLVGSRMVLTAFHCVRDAVRAGAEIKLEFLDAGLQMSATVIGYDENLDACLLAVAQDIEAAPIDLVVGPRREGVAWHAFGFPTAKMDVGHRLEGKISQVLPAPVMKMDVDLVIDPTFSLSDYAGLSGALLVVGLAANAMLRLSVDKALGAISVGAMADFLQSTRLR